MEAVAEENSQLPVKQQEHAGFAVRGAAAIIDQLIVGIPLSILLTIMRVSNDAIENYASLGVLVYMTLMTGTRSTTIGKKYFNLQVVRTDDSKMDLTRAFVREIIGKLISYVVLFIGIFWIIFDKQKQGWHDKIAGTYVVYTAPLSRGKKLLANILILVIPGLAFLGILGILLLVILNPKGQLEKARQQQQLQQQIQQNIENQIQTD